MSFGISTIAWAGVAGPIARSGLQLRAPERVARRADVDALQLGRRNPAAPPLAAQRLPVQPQSNKSQDTSCITVCHRGRTYLLQGTQLHDTKS